MMFDYKLRTDIIYIYCNTNGLGLGHYQIKLTWICVRSIDERDWITDSMDRNRLIDGLILNHGEAKISDHLPLLIDCAHLWTLVMQQVWGGNPAKFLRKLTDEEVAFISESAANYANLAQVHAAENVKSFDEIEFEKVLRKKFARRDEEYDSMLGVVREVPPELILPDNVLPDKSRKPSQ